MDTAELMFFDGRAAALPLYEALKNRIDMACIGPVIVKAQKTQISFYNRRMFACVSFLPLGRGKERPPVYLTVSFGLDHRQASPRIGAAVQARPNRWTHHVMISSPEEIDEELLSWLTEASTFSATK